jgi:hypothetical protein
MEWVSGHPLVSSWMQLVSMDMKIKPPNGFVLTSHSLRKGATTIAHAIEVPMQKIIFSAAGRWTDGVKRRSRLHGPHYRTYDN